MWTALARKAFVCYEIFLYCRLNVLVFDCVVSGSGIIVPSLSQGEIYRLAMFHVLSLDLLFRAHLWLKNVCGETGFLSFYSLRVRNVSSPPLRGG